MVADALRVGAHIGSRNGLFQAPSSIQLRGVRRRADGIAPTTAGRRSELRTASPQIQLTTANGIRAGAHRRFASARLLFLREIHSSVPRVCGTRDSEVSMNAPREPNVRIRTAQPFDQVRSLGRQNSGPHLHRAILTLSSKSACQNISGPGAAQSSDEEPGKRTR